jgi:hypothetical protein
VRICSKALSGFSHTTEAAFFNLMLVLILSLVKHFLDNPVFMM